MKTLFTILILFFSLGLNAQVFIHAGTSPIKGSVGIELQPLVNIPILKNLSIGGGYRFTHVYPAGDIHSWSGNLNYYFSIEPALLYVSIGVASKGIVAKYDYFFWDHPVPAEYLMLGTRYYPCTVAKKFPKRISFDIGMGVSRSDYTAPELVIDFEINFAITKVK